MRAILSIETISFRPPHARQVGAVNSAFARQSFLAAPMANPYNPAASLPSGAASAYERSPVAISLKD